MNTSAETTPKLRIEAGQTRLYAPHQGKELCFMHPYHGPNTYANVAGSIDRAGLARPTMAETASFLVPAFKYDENEQYLRR